MHRAALIVLLSAGEALAHPDHGRGGWLSAELWHLLSAPDHLAMILLPVAVGAGWLLRRALRARATRRASSAAGLRRDS
jgi:hydrogenase/urease accessory protein HupE